MYNGLHHCLSVVRSVRVENNGNRDKSRKSTKLGRKILSYVSNYFERGATKSVSRGGGGGGGLGREIFVMGNQFTAVYFEY